jgi:hypothetical protein
MRLSCHRELHLASPAYRPLEEKDRAFFEGILREKNPESQVILLDETAIFLKEFAHSPNLDTIYTPYSMLRMIFDLETRLPSGSSISTPIR